MSSEMCVLITGGAGYIGSHVTLQVLEAGIKAVVVDNLCNSSEESLRRVEEITGKKIKFYKLDILDQCALRQVFKENVFSAVMHFAGYKAVGESCDKPFMYYKNNVQGSLSLLEVMSEYGMFNIIFSSSCTVYGSPQSLPLNENSPTGACTNPYGRTKYFIEQILQDVCSADSHWNIVSLRYFNPVGAHKSGLIGEDPCGPPNNLMPYIAQVAVGLRDQLSVFGNDYDTPDGTGVRDYIHVVDLAAGHVAALKKLEENCGFQVYNLGTGNGYSVLQLVQAFEKASEKQISYRVVGRRNGDVGTIYADSQLATKELEWKAEKTLADMCEDTWRWQRLNPKGYSTTCRQKQENGCHVN